MRSGCNFLLLLVDAAFIRTQEGQDTLGLSKDEVRKRTLIRAATVNVNVPGQRSVVGAAVVLSVMVDTAMIGSIQADIAIDCTRVVCGFVVQVCVSCDCLIHSGKNAGKGTCCACRSHSGACLGPARAVAVFCCFEPTANYDYERDLSGSESETV